MRLPWRDEAWSRTWGIERSLLVASVLVFVVSAADTSGDPLWRSTFVAAGFGVAGLVSLAWYRGEVTTREVLFFAALFRLAALPLLPSLSDDGFRYVWDGWLQGHDIDPYVFRPTDAALEGSHWSELFSQLNSASYYSVYPPASQLVFYLGSLVGAESWAASWYAIKVVFVAIEWGGVWALSRMVSARSLLLYAWHPLVVIEVAGQGHTEAGMVGFLLLSLLVFRSQYLALSVGAVTVAGWFKLYPLLLLPFLLRRVGWRFVWVAGVVSVLLLWPFVSPYAIPHVRESLELYTRLFEFNAGPYFVIKSIGLTGSGSDWSKTLGPFFQAVFLISVVTLLFISRRKQWSLEWTWVAVLGLLWATATTVHPWYLIGILALLPLTLDRSTHAAVRLHAAAWLWLSVVSIGTYLLYTHGDTLYWTSVIVGWGGWVAGFSAALALLALPTLIRRRAARKWQELGPLLGTPAHILDLGAGEGYVGEVAARASGARVTLADVVDFNRTRLPLVLYDGHRLLFEDDEFDATLLVFVLHHAGDAEAVLREARRVTTPGGRVGVLESVAESRFDRFWLPFADRLANRLRSGGRMNHQELFLHFRSTAEWRLAFERAGYEVEVDSRRGHVFHKQALFVLR